MGHWCQGEPFFCNENGGGCSEYKQGKSISTQKNISKRLLIIGGSLQQEDHPTVGLSETIKQHPISPLPTPSHPSLPLPDKSPQGAFRAAGLGYSARNRPPKTPYPRSPSCTLPHVTPDPPVLPSVPPPYMLRSYVPPRSLETCTNAPTSLALLA